MAECNVCGCAYVDPEIPSEELLSYYPETYYLESAPEIGSYLTKAALFASPLSKEIRRLLESPASGHRRRILELGCATGNNLSGFAETGWEAVGIEPNPRLARLAEAKGIRVVHGFLRDAPRDIGSFDAAILSHVLEHDANPLGILDYVRDCLVPGGHVVIEVPVLDSPSIRLFREYYGELEFPVHLTFLTPSALTEHLRKRGFVIERARARTLVGSVARTLRKRLNLRRPKGKFRGLVIASVFACCQIPILALNTITGTGEAYLVVARLESAKQGAPRDR